MLINFFVIARILVGSLFVVSGFEKLIGPQQNFLYVVQSYELFGAFLENTIAYIMPWIEFFLGVFFVLGFCFKWVSRAVRVLFTGFMVVVCQAIMRCLQITECGCFGELISFPLNVVRIFDCTFLILLSILAQKEERANVFSLDHYFGV